MPKTNGITLLHVVVRKFSWALHSPAKKGTGLYVKGGALYISILVSILIGITLSLFILLGNYNQRTVTVLAQDSQLYFNLKSAFQLAQSAYFSQEQNNTWIKNQLNDDSIKVKKINWGAYLIICAQSKNRHHSLSQSGLFGTYMSADTGLMVSDNSRPVGLSGSIRFQSNCYLPRAGIKPAYIEGQSYQSSSNNGTFLKASPNQIPQLDPKLVKALKEEQEGLNVYLDSLVSYAPPVYNQAFEKKTLVCQLNTTQLSQLRLKNNIKLICGAVDIDSSCHFENILIICKKARFKQGFKGQVHVIASDSISMESNCEFQYPSSFVLLPDQSSGTTFNSIQFNKDCKFSGGVLAVNETSRSENSHKVFIKLHAGSEINGLIYSSDYVHLEGLLNASAIANKLLLKTPSAVYENHILSCEINPKKYGSLMAVPLLFDQRNKLLCCANLN